MIAPLDLDGALRRFRALLKSDGLRCYHADAQPDACEGSVEMESSCTAYYWDGKGADPNASIPLCRFHAKEHHEYWAEMWADYRASQY